VIDPDLLAAALRKHSACTTLLAFPNHSIVIESGLQRFVAISVNADGRFAYYQRIDGEMYALSWPPPYVVEAVARLK
jgi:hypothetical protein